MKKTTQYTFESPFVLESGNAIEDLKLTYTCYGNFDPNQNNVVWVFHALTANSEVLDWWPGLFGQGDVFDPAEHFIVCVNTPGSPYGSSSPRDYKANESSYYGLNFPEFTVRDIAKSMVHLTRELGIERIHTIIGGSFGGYQALEFALLFEGTIDHAILLATSAKESPWGKAIHETQRMILQSDPTFKLNTEEAGQQGLIAARAHAMLFYRNSEIMDKTQEDELDQLDDYNASSYIRYQGNKFAGRFHAHCYYSLQKCLDTHHIGRSRGGIRRALARLQTNALVIGFSSDLLIPFRHQEELANGIPGGSFHLIESAYGHDGFLVETGAISDAITHFYNNQEQLQVHEIS